MNLTSEVLSQIQALKEKGLKLYNEKNYSESLEIWNQILKLDSNNSYAILYTKRIEQAISIKKMQQSISKLNEQKTLEQSVSEFKENNDSKTLEVKDKIKVMVVDDSNLMRRSISSILSKSGMEVMEASGGEDALQKISKSPPDLVTLDVNMPGMDGITTLQQIMIENPLPVIMLSAFLQDGANITFDCLSYGAVDFVSKPSQFAGSLENNRKRYVKKLEMLLKWLFLLQSK